jgi:hypothetical protein
MKCQDVIKAAACTTTTRDGVRRKHGNTLFRILPPLLFASTDLLDAYEAAEV